MIKVIAILFAGLFLTIEVHAQIKNDFVSIFSELIKPPANCEEASLLYPLDTNLRSVSAGEEISTQEEKLKKIQDGIINDLNSLRAGENMHKPPGNGPPGGMTPPAGGFNYGDYSDIKEIMDKRAKASESITINMNLYKKETLKNQEELNIKLKKTKQTEEDLRLSYVNEFLKVNESNYNKNHTIILKNVTDLVNTFKDDKSAGKDNYPPVKAGLLKVESELINTALLLFNITKQIAEAGSMFFYGIK